METHSNQDINFKIKDKVFTYRFRFVEDPASLDMVEVDMRSSEYGSSRMPFGFQQQLPTSRKVFHKLLGGWVRNQILYSEQEVQAGPGTDDSAFKKLRSYAYLRSVKISGVLSSWILREFSDRWSLYEGHMQDIDNLAFRLFQGRRSGTPIYRELFKLSLELRPEVYNILKRDLMKYPVAFGVEIVDSLHGANKPQTVSEYNQVLKGIPDIFKKNRYGLMIQRSDFVEKYAGPLPATRWGWFAFRIALANLDKDSTGRASMFCIEQDEKILEFSRKMLLCDIAVWHYYKKHMHIVGPYNTKQIRHMFQTVMDGDRIYKQREDNEHKISFVPVEGSAMRMVRNAIYNHRQEQELSKTRRLSDKDYVLKVPFVKLPDWVEAIRIKTAHQMISAGIECQHCIGSYVHSPDIFVREKDVCAQIDRESMQVVQCYDVHDQITKASEYLKQRLNKALKPIAVTV